MEGIMIKNILEEIRKEQVLNATQKLIIDKGYSNFSMKDVASEMGMSTGMIYHYFENKEDLLLNALKYSFANPYKKVMETVDPLEEYFDKISTYFDNISDSQTTSTDFWVLLINYLGQVRYAPDISRIMQKFISNIRNYVDEIFQLGIAQGIIDKESVHGLSEIIIGASMGLAFQQIIDPDNLDLTSVMAKQKEVILHYLCSQQAQIKKTEDD
jgi:AcrR family transcriptional regulator